MDPVKVQTQLDENRRTVAFDSYDLAIRQLYDMIADEIIDIAPEYQRHFVWDEEKQSQLVESLFLGIPVPNLFMATNKDSTWEVVDGLQRLTTIINFIGNEGNIKKVNQKGEKLKIKGLEKLSELNGLYYEDMPKSLQLLFMTRPIRVTVLNDRSDLEVRFDLFERLNTGGVTLHPQEIRNCIYLGEFNEFLKECSKDINFRKVVKMTKNAERTGNWEELVLKFFAYYECRENFTHSVKEFLNDYMEQKTTSFKNRKELKEIFAKTFLILSENLSQGIVRGDRKNITPLILFEAISIGLADAIEEGKDLKLKKLESLLDDPTLKKYTTGATNSKPKLNQRIDFVKKRLLG
jgi:uncharacterized protein with ParB-like and HNH nuclease domain